MCTAIPEWASSSGQPPEVHYPPDSLGKQLPCSVQGGKCLPPALVNQHIKAEIHLPSDLHRVKIFSCSVATWTSIIPLAEQAFQVMISLILDICCKTINITGQITTDCKFLSRWKAGTRYSLRSLPTQAVYDCMMVTSAVQYGRIYPNKFIKITLFFFFSFVLSHHWFKTPSTHLSLEFFFTTVICLSEDSIPEFQDSNILTQESVSHK